MDYQELLNVALNFATAILLGALVGIEREKRKAEEDEAGGIAGLRTFTLLALFGAAAGLAVARDLIALDLGGGLLIVGAFVVAGYVVAARADPESTGLTTEVAAVVVFLLGAMVMFGHPELAVGLGVVTAAVLAYKRPLHGFVDKLGWDDVYAGLRLLIATFIALPLLPDQTDRPVGRAQSLQVVAAGDPDLEPVAGRLCADAAARTGARHGAHRIGGRSRLVDRGHLVVRARRGATSRKDRRRSLAASCSPGR